MTTNSTRLGLAIVLALATATSCAVSDDPRPDRPASELTTASRAAPAPGFCGVSPTSITYWATQWQMEVMDFDGMIGGCDFDSSCLPSCWGGTSDWTTWSAPLIQCPCRADGN